METSKVPAYITKRKIYAPEGTVIRDFDDIKISIFENERERNGTPVFVARAFQGRQQKPEKSYYFDDKLARANWINNYLKDKYKSFNYHKERKELKKIQDEKDFKELKIGDVFYTSWGYDQTNVDFYELISIKSKTGTFERLGKRSSKEKFMSAQVFPGERTGKRFIARLKGNTFKADYGQTAWKTDRESSHYSSWYA